LVDEMAYAQPPFQQFRNRPTNYSEEENYRQYYQRAEVFTAMAMKILSSVV
jgi:hypothetical protein